MQEVRRYLYIEVLLLVITNIMFSLLLNDLPDSVRDGHVLMFADDVAAIVTAPTTKELEMKLNTVSNSLYRWFKINGMILNLHKTCFTRFDLSGHKTDPLNVMVRNEALKHLQVMPFLGFQIDSALTWTTHVDTLCEKIGRACFALWRLSAILPRSMVRDCYFASVHSLLQYGIEFWGCSADWLRAFRIQKRALRAIARVREDQSALPLFREMRILTVPCMVILQAALYAWDHLDEYPRLRTARHARVLWAPARRLTKESRQVHVLATEVYNRIPDEIKDAPSRESYKIRMKKWLVEKSFYSIGEMITG